MTEVKKKRKVKPKIEPKNKEQELAIQAGRDFIENGNPKEFFIIGGKAGTGKTTIAAGILEPFIKTHLVLVCALSHKAKLVITEKLEKVFGKNKIISKSVAGALGMNMDNETGLFTLESAYKRTQPIKRAKIILCDEASMINEESHRLIMTEKQKKAMVIFLGDIRQLPPIRETGHPNEDKCSPVFYGKNLAVLTERIRQGEESPILPFADYFGDNSRLNRPLLNPAPQEARVNTVGDKGALVFSGCMEDVIDAVLPLYKYAVEKRDTNIVKIVSYRNDARRYINSLVRELIFGRDQAKQQFLVGDLLMFQDNHDVKGLDDPISNSLEVQVNKVTPKDDKDYRVWEIDFIHESKSLSMLVLHTEDAKRHATEVSRLFQEAKSLPYGSDERTEALRAAWGLKKRYAPIDYAYAITSHKSQGSTYNTVVVDEMDIMSVSMTSNKSKSQSMYTALTRASISCIVVDGQEADETLQQAVDLGYKAIV